MNAVSENSQHLMLASFRKARYSIGVRDWRKWRNHRERTR